LQIRRFRLRQSRERDRDGGASIRTRVDLDFALTLLYESMHDGQPQARADALNLAIVVV
jgi:hypothetical protein